MQDSQAGNTRKENADSNSRRKFLKNVTAMGIATVGYGALPSLSVTSAQAAEIGPVNAHGRREQCFQLRLAADVANKNRPIEPQTST